MLLCSSPCRRKLLGLCSRVILLRFSFGRVISGQDVVSAIEQVGSESGATRVAVVIADCGQLR
jgi:cyclophilin family peptidyl-prolyl cis-trans isomerase